MPKARGGSTWSGKTYGKIIKKQSTLHLIPELGSLPLVHLFSAQGVFHPTASKGPRMKKIDHKDFEKSIVVRPIRLADYEALVGLQLRCFPGMKTWRRDQS